MQYFPTTALSRLMILFLPVCVCVVGLAVSHRRQHPCNQTPSGSQHTPATPGLPRRKEVGPPDSTLAERRGVSVAGVDNYRWPPVTFSTGTPLSSRAAMRSRASAMRSSAGTDSGPPTPVTHTAVRRRHPRPPPPRASAGQRASDPLETPNACAPPPTWSAFGRWSASASRR